MTLEHIKALEVGQQVRDLIGNGYVSIRRKPDTAIGKPRYKVFAHSGKVSWSQGTFCAETALQLANKFMAHIEGI